MRAATCFSGIGAPEVAMPEWDWLWHAEVEPFPSSVMADRHLGSMNLGNVMGDDFMERAAAFGPLDVLMGGPPCQAFSVAGLRQSLSDARGNLSLRWVQIIHAIGPVWAVTENVPGWLSTADNAFGCFLGAIVGADDALHSPLEQGRWPSAGMVAGPRARAAWRILDAQYFGLAQLRQRVFVVISFRDWADPSQILFERKSLRGDSPPSREAGERVAGTIDGGAHPGSYNGQDAYNDKLYNGPQYGEFLSDGSCYTLNCTEHHAIALTAKDYGADAEHDLSPTIRAGGHDNSHANGGVMPAVTVALRGREGGRMCWRSNRKHRPTKA